MSGHTNFRVLRARVEADPVRGARVEELTRELLRLERCYNRPWRRVARLAQSVVKRSS